jgi:hypothetical protein
MYIQICIISVGGETTTMKGFGDTFYICIYIYIYMYIYMYIYIYMVFK